ncbi:MAG TPA: hypothetical protein VF490_08585 [Chryseosolibacter sp.]
MKIFRIIKFIAINLAVFAVLLVIVNWACSAYLKSQARDRRDELPNYSRDYEHARAVFADYHRLRHQYEPFVGWKTLPYSGKTTHVSKDGLRAVGADTTDAEGRMTARFFGGSTMWGEGSDDEHTIPALFGKLHADYKVFNHGQLAYNTRQELDDLISVYSRNERTDLVIFYDGVNDAAFLCPRVIRSLPAHRLVPMYREKLYAGNFALVKQLATKLFIDDILNVVQKLTYRPTPENSPYDCVSNPEKAEAIADMMMKNWEMAHELVTNRGGTFMAILQPAAYIGKARTDHLKLDEELGSNFRVIYRLLKQKIAAKNYPWILDLSEKFDGDEYIFVDFCHVSPNGNEIIAREISNALAPKPGER